MRSFLQWTIAYAFAIASAVLASTFAFLSATGAYAYAKAAILCLVAFGGCHGPAYTAKLRRSSGWMGAGLATLATAACLLVTLWGGLGTIAGGGAEIRAERKKAASDDASDRADLSRLRTEREALPHARPAAAVSADLITARASTLYKATEGCDPDRIVGQKSRDHCKLYRQLEAELAAANAAARLESEAKVVSARLQSAAPVAESDPQAAAFSLLTGFSIELSAALYAFAASLALEAMGMVAMMVAWSERKEPTPAKSVEPALEQIPAAEIVRTSAVQKPDRRQAVRTADVQKPSTNVVPISQGAVFGSVRKFMLQCLAPAAGERLEMRAVFTEYQAWCKGSGLPTASLDKFMDEIDHISRTAGIEIAVEGDKVYCLGVRLTA